MIRREIPATGETLPVMGMGTWQTFDVGTGARQRDPLRAVLDTFIGRRGTLVDLSPMYGRAEEVLGQIAGESGILPKLFIATKVWTTGRDEGIAQMEDSCRLLGGRIDLMQCTTCSMSTSSSRHYASGRPRVAFATSASRIIRTVRTMRS